MVKALLCLFLMLIIHSAQCFHVRCRAELISSCRLEVMPHSLQQFGKSQNVRKVFQIVALSPLLLTTFPRTTRAESVQVDESVFIDALATLAEAKLIMEPTKRYVENAKTNIKFILNQLQLDRKVSLLIRNSVDFTDDSDAIDAAGEAGNRLTNTAMQYDSTVYTCVFIPTVNGEIPPSAEKYRKQANDFYDQFNSDIDIMLKVGSAAQLKEADTLASERLQLRPKVLFKKI